MNLSRSSLVSPMTHPASGWWWCRSLREVAASV